MALKNTQIPITMAVYQLKMERVIDLGKKLPLDEALTLILEEASKYRITDMTITRKRAKRSKVKKLKVYHDISCNCYDCRAGLSLRAKD